MRLLALLIAAAMAEQTPLLKQPPSAEALNCLKAFVDKYDSLTYYTAKMKKSEFDFGAKPIVENLRITEKNKSEIELEFLDQGISGIKNNGMKVTYSKGDTVGIELGTSRGIGIIANGLAELFSKRIMKITDSQVVADQIFTTNRAGFGYFAKTLKRRLPELASGGFGRLTKMPGSCDLHFEPDESLALTVELQPTDSIPDIEERYGTIAYLIYKDNANLFSDFSELLNRKKPVKVKISPTFTDFNLKLAADGLPEKVEIFWAKKLLGRYEFSQTESH